MTRKTMVALIAQADATIEDNISGNISASDVRQMFKDFIDTMTPGFGAIGRATQTLANLGTTPVVVTYDTTMALTSDFTVNLALGEITRQSLGLPTVNNRVTFYAGVEGPAGSEYLFTLFRDGVSISGGTTVSGQGLGNPVQATFEIINAAPIAGNPVYKVMTSKISGAAANTNLIDVRFIAEVVPTIGV